MFSRRDFIKQGLLPVFAGSAVPSIFANGVAAAAADSPQATPNGRILVLVQLAGGNDGLNTLIPFQDGAYHDARPTLRQDTGVLTLNNQLGLNPKPKGLEATRDAGDRPGRRVSAPQPVALRLDVDLGDRQCPGRYRRRLAGTLPQLPRPGG